MSIESYGGNPDIVATHEEIQRVALEIKLCVETLNDWNPLESLWSDPLQQIQYRVLCAAVLQKLEKLYSHCLIAAENYFTTEAQIHRRFEITFVPELAQFTTNIATALGWKLDRKVSAKPSLETSSTETNSITQMLDRLWRLSAKDKPTIGIDLFDNPSGNKTAVVYVPGTQTLGFGEGTNPLDMASNIQAISGAGKARKLCCSPFDKQVSIQLTR